MTVTIDPIAARQKLITEARTQVTFEGAFGDDLRIVNAARTSFGKRSKWNGRQYVLSDADAGLISYLMRERHGTPFEMVQFQFHVAGPIRVLREWQRHRIGSFNEISTRYVEMEPRMFVPFPEDVRVQEGKPGHYVMRDAPELAPAVIEVMLISYAESWAAYEALLGMGVAKELAAYVLPVGLFSEMIWSVNLRSLFNFVSLRNAGNALREIRYAAQKVERIAYQVVPYAMEAFEKAGRVAP